MTAAQKDWGSGTEKGAPFPGALLRQNNRVSAATIAYPDRGPVFNFAEALVMLWCPINDGCRPSQTPA
jgi:hypothetical protein